MKKRPKMMVVDLCKEDFRDEFDLPENHNFYAFTCYGDEDSAAEYVIFMNEEKCDEENVYCQVLAHEFGHVVHGLMGWDDNENDADDFGFDLCEELEIDTKIYHHWAKFNAENP